ncbi:response regulator transcription factor [Dialister sp.]|uniref:response regulator transcription factor n=1 Tax=Dialister sp. TaxID=1955814 RepID=UPI0025F92145|nr:response regulator transcription factor [Dialister sp.]
MRLLLAEDEKDMADVLLAIFKHQGFEADWAENGAIAVDLAQKKNYDCMIFDIMMPVKDGITALKELREAGDVTPVIMLTAKSEVDDRITGLDSGADDYLTKPFAIGELLARIRSLTRRNKDFTPTILSAGSTSLDTEEQELSAHNSIRLSGKETKLMKLFMLNENKELSTSYLFQKIWSGEEGVDESVVWIYISYLREKLSAINSDLSIFGEEGQSFRLALRED